MRLRQVLSGALLLTSALFPATGAHARDFSDSDKARSTMRRVISCAMYFNMQTHGAEGAVTVIEGNPKGKAFDELSGSIERCVWLNNYQGRWVDKLRFDPAVLKGEIFRSIVLDGWGIQARKDLLPEFRRLANVPRDPASNPLGAFGVCVATLDPQNARKAIASLTAGPDESAAYSALASSLSRCVSPGQSITFSRQVLEDSLAEGLFVSTFATPAKGAVWEEAK